MDCGFCFFSELIDGVCFCHYIGEDVFMDGLCVNFVNVDRLKEIIGHCSEYDCLDEFFEEFNRLL